MFESPESKLLAIILSIMIVLYIIKPDSGNKRELKENDRKHAVAIDSIVRLQRIQSDSTKYFREQSIKSQIATREAVADRDKARQQRAVAQQKYESIRHRNYTSVELDSVLRALYPTK